MLPKGESYFILPPVFINLPVLLHKVLGEAMLCDIGGKGNYYFMLKLNVCDGKLVVSFQK